MLTDTVFWEYIMIFIMAATPWLEILVVIPIGIALGLNPVLVAIVSFVGNFLPILLIVYLFKWFQRTAWYQRRLDKRRMKRLKNESTMEIEEDLSLGKIEEKTQVVELDRSNEYDPLNYTNDLEQGDTANPTSSTTLHDTNTAEKEQNDEREKLKKKPSKKEKAAAIFHKYGLPGLAFAGPILTGIHLAAIIALSLKADKNRTTLWMGASLIAWTIVLTVASFYSIDWLTDWL